MLGGDRGDLGRCFAQAEDDFGEALADGAVVIDAGEAQILERAARAARRAARSASAGVELRRRATSSSSARS